ncbi:MAG: CPBP family intramembrane metalloprotease [Cyanobacteria bacterium]|nr:CPBP family intramembrane metalloprotease [Cyanobacteriota bacterium]MDW8202404.1 type II CAAX endopeptidase family protein [Cyanobacteriota bacterium SKYGB_h_bin112]
MTPRFSRISTYPVVVRLVIFVGLLVIVWAPLGLSLYDTLDSRWASILPLLLLYVEFLALAQWWGRAVYGEPHMLRRYGLVWAGSSSRYLLLGLVIGSMGLLSMFTVQSLVGWVTWQLKGDWPRLAVEGLLVASGIGFAEEVLFRGWLLDELERDYAPSASLYASSIIFALLHFIKPLDVVLKTLPQFLGLVLLGMALVWAKRAARGTLGLAIGLHAGLVGGYYLVNVGSLVAYSDGVPQWVTGIDRNPLAGAVGLVYLGVIALWMRQWAITAGQVVRGNE